MAEKCGLICAECGRNALASDGAMGADFCQASVGFLYDYQLVQCPDCWKRYSRPTRSNPQQGIVDKTPWLEVREDLAPDFLTDLPDEFEQSLPHCCCYCTSNIDDLVISNAEILHHLWRGEKPLVTGLIECAREYGDLQTAVDVACGMNGESKEIVAISMKIGRCERTLEKLHRMQRERLLEPGESRVVAQMIEDCEGLLSWQRAKLARLRRLRSASTTIKTEKIPHGLRYVSYRYGIVGIANALLWSDGIVPMEVPTECESLVLGAAKIFKESQDKVQFCLRDKDDVHWIKFVAGQAACESESVGRCLAEGPQTINLCPGCTVGQVVREMFHALGFYGEDEHVAPKDDSRTTWVICRSQQPTVYVCEAEERDRGSVLNMDAAGLARVERLGAGDVDAIFRLYAGVQAVNLYAVPSSDK